MFGGFGQQQYGAGQYAPGQLLYYPVAGVDWGAMITQIIGLLFPMIFMFIILRMVTGLIKPLAEGAE